MTTLGSIGDDEIINIRLNSERPLTIRDDWDSLDTYLWQSISSRGNGEGHYSSLRMEVGNHE